MDTAVKSRLARRLVPLLVLVVLTLGAAPEVTGQAPPAGEAVIAWPITISPTWFDPSPAPPHVTPFGILYALHDALVRPLPGQKMGNSMAESWRESPDGLIYEFKLRRGLKFHNGDDVTGDDVKFSFERYKSARPSGGRRRSAHGAIRAQRAVAGFHDLLRDHRHGSGDRRAEEVRHPRRRRGIPKAPDRRRPLQVRQP